MANYYQRLKVLEQRVVDAVGAIPAIVQLIDGTRTHEQQVEYDNAIANDVFVVTISVKDFRKSRTECSNDYA